MRNRTAQERATQLRRRTTDAERALWFHLRRKHLVTCRFRRQVPIGCFIVDFACLRPKLIVELDGSQHFAQHPYDESRDAWLKRRGFRVLRFWDNDVLLRMDAVLEVIVRALEGMRNGSPPP